MEGGSSGESKYAEIIGRRHYWVICDGEVVGGSRDSIITRRNGGRPSSARG